MRRIHTNMLGLSAALLLAGQTQAMGFAEAYDAARRHDPQFRAAAFELESARQGVPIARAALLPAVGLSMSTSETIGSRQFPNSLNQDTRVRVEYAAPQANLTLRMPIFNQEAASRLGQARAQSEVAEAVYLIKGIDLVDRLAAAYLQVLVAEEAGRLGEAQVQALAAQAAQAQKRLQQGEGTRVELANAQANLDVARVRLVEAKDQIDLSRRQLRRITGLEAPPMRQVPANYAPPPLQTEALQDWLALAVRQNPSIQAREQALMAAKMGVKRNFAGHLPRVDLVASVSRSQNESLSSLNQTSTLRTLGVQMNMPLYNGGGVDASVKQAMADQARAEEDIRTERENIEIEVQRQYQSVANGQERIVAYQRAVDSAELALLGARRALEAGQGTQNEVADNIARAFGAKRDLAQVRVEYLLARLRLMLQAGMSTVEVMSDLDRTLVESPGPVAAATR